MMPALASIGPTAYWYLTRATGIVALVLLTGATVLGVVHFSRRTTERWPRFAIDALHRSVSLFALAFLVIHIVTSVLDSFAPIGWLDAVIPLHSAYRPLWLGLGAVSFDLLLAVIVTSLLRGAFGYNAWRAVHWLAYLCWPVAVVHGLGTGSDTKSSWLLIINAVCVAAVGGAVIARVFDPPRPAVQMRAAAVATTVGFALGLIVWLPSGPLGRGWARRSGTPVSLLAHPTTTRPRGG
jgi:predicted ferric reductase